MFAYCYETAVGGTSMSLGETRILVAWSEMQRQLAVKAIVTDWFYHVPGWLAC